MLGRCPLGKQLDNTAAALSRLGLEVGTLGSAVSKQ